MKFLQERLKVVAGQKGKKKKGEEKQQTAKEREGEDEEKSLVVLH